MATQLNMIGSFILKYGCAASSLSFHTFTYKMLKQRLKKHLCVCV